VKPPLLINRYTFPNGKHYRIQVRAVPCRFGGGTSSDCSTEGLHVHLSASMLDPLPITYRGMVTWPTRRRRRRRP
jgi:hypothetical protein